LFVLKFFPLQGLQDKEGLSRFDFFDNGEIDNDLDDDG
jgi:hypothetical protein